MAVRGWPCLPAFLRLTLIHCVSPPLAVSSCTCAPRAWPTCLCWRSSGRHTAREKNPQSRGLTPQAPKCQSLQTVVRLAPYAPHPRARRRQCGDLTSVGLRPFLREPAHQKSKCQTVVRFATCTSRALQTIPSMWRPYFRGPETFPTQACAPEEQVPKFTNRRLTCASCDRENAPPCVQHTHQHNNVEKLPWRPACLAPIGSRESPATHMASARVRTTV